MIVKRNNLDLFLSFQPPYQWEILLHFLSGRAIKGVEMVRGGAYFRTVWSSDENGRYVYGWLKVSPHPRKDFLVLTVNQNLASLLPKIKTRVRHLFDLDSEPEKISRTLISLNTFRKGLYIPGVRMPGCFDSFEMAVRAVLGQQITVKAASTLAGRLAEAYGIPVQTGIEGLTHTFPTPEKILSLESSIADSLGPLGIISRRSKTILEIARAMVEGTINFSTAADPEEEIKKFMKIPGIGEWTAHYIAMRAMGWRDAFPHTDYGVKKALAPRTPKEILALAESWRPYRGYAAISLWNSL